jgi:hypothetical protein
MTSIAFSSCFSLRLKPYSILIVLLVFAQNLFAFSNDIDSIPIVYLVSVQNLISFSSCIALCISHRLSLHHRWSPSTTVTSGVPVNMEELKHKLKDAQEKLNVMWEEGNKYQDQVKWVLALTGKDGSVGSRGRKGIGIPSFSGADGRAHRG